MQQHIPVFVRGAWLPVAVPNHLTSSAMRFAYATAWVAARQKDMSEHDSHIVAEAIVYQRMYPGLVHSEKVRDMIQKMS